MNEVDALRGADAIPLEQDVRMAIPAARIPRQQPRRTGEFGQRAADYNLSKRTDVYVQGGYVMVADGESAAGTGLEVAANPDAYGPSSTNSQFVGRVGIRHHF